MLDQCPGCGDAAIYAGLDEFGDEAWLARDWRAWRDGHDVVVAFCPFCGRELPEPEEEKKRQESKKEEERKKEQRIAERLSKYRIR